MKNTFISFAILVLVVTSSSFASSGKDNDNTADASGTAPAANSGSYKIYLDGDLFLEATNVISVLGYSEINPDEYTNEIGLGLGLDNIVNVNGYPLNVGDEITFGAAGEPGVIFFKANDRYFSISGIMTRESSKKVTFEGVCVDITDMTTKYALTGYIDSDVLNDL